MHDAKLRGSRDIALRLKFRLFFIVVFLNATIQYNTNHPSDPRGDTNRKIFDITCAEDDDTSHRSTDSDMVVRNLSLLHDKRSISFCDSAEYSRRLFFYSRRGCENSCQNPQSQTFRRHFEMRYLPQGAPLSFLLPKC